MALYKLIKIYLLHWVFIITAPHFKHKINLTAQNQTAQGFLLYIDFATASFKQTRSILMHFSNNTPHPIICYFRQGKIILCLPGPDLAPVSCPV